MYPITFWNEKTSRCEREKEEENITDASSSRDVIGRTIDTARKRVLQQQPATAAVSQQPAAVDPVLATVAACTTRDPAFSLRATGLKPVFKKILKKITNGVTTRYSV